MLQYFLRLAKNNDEEEAHNGKDNPKKGENIVKNDQGDWDSLNSN